MVGTTNCEILEIGTTPEYAAGTLALLPRHTRHLGVLAGGLAVPIDQQKLRKLIDIAVRYRGRLSALKARDLQASADKWQLIAAASATNNTRETGELMESFWRNKSLFVRRVSRKEEFGPRYLPQFTEIACVISGQTKVLLTILENDQQAKFEVISESGKSGYCLEGLDNDLSLSQVFNLLAEIEGA